MKRSGCFAATEAISFSLWCWFHSSLLNWIIITTFFINSTHFSALISKLCDPHSSGGDLESFYLFDPPSVGELLPSSPAWPFSNDSSPTSMRRQWICASCPSQYLNIFWYLRFHSDVLSVRLWKHRYVSIIHDDLHACLSHSSADFCVQTEQNFFFFFRFWHEWTVTEMRIKIIAAEAECKWLFASFVSIIC